MAAPVVAERLAVLHVEYAELLRKYSILFIFNLLCEYIDLAYVRVPVVSRVNQVKYGIPMLMAVSQEYVSTDLTRRLSVPLRHGPNL